MLREFQELATDNTSGATELVHRLLALCENCAMGYHFDELRQGFALLETSQISMPSLHAVLHILKGEFLPKLLEGEETAEAIVYLSSLQNILEESGEAISRYFSSKFDKPTRVVTISRSLTVLSALNTLAEKGKLRHLYVCESRPMMEGVRTIRDCCQHSINSTLIVDSALMEVLPNTDIAIVGADSVSADGFLLNKTGTFPLGICCKELGIPLYVLCDSLKFSPQLKENIRVEESPESEILERKTADTFCIHNCYFEWMPVDYVTAFITERGEFPPDQLTRLAGEDAAENSSP